MNNKNSLPKYASKLIGKLTQQFISPNVNNVSIDSTKDPKKEMEELKNTFVQYDKYIKSIIDEKKHFQKGDRANYLNQTSKMSSQQKSQIMKTEEKMLKITLQQFINFDEKNKNNKNQGPTLLLNDKENIGLSNDEKINELLKILEHHNECVMERPYCKNLQDIIILELFLNFSQLGCSLNLSSNEKSEKIKKIKNYLKQLTGNVQYDLFSSPNYTLNYISQKLIDISELYNRNNKSNKLNLQSFFSPEESDSENSIPNYGEEEEEESSEKSDDSCNEEVVAEEINEEYSHKLIFFDEKKKNIVNISRGANELTIDPNESYIEKKNYLLKLRENAYDNIIEIINTESLLLPKYKHTMNYEELIGQVKEINEKKKKEKENEINDNYININSEDEDEYEDDNCSQLISQIHTYSNKYIKSYNKSLDHVSLYKKSNFPTSINLVNILSKNTTLKKIKEDFNDILNIFPYLPQRQNSDLSIKKLHILKQKRNDEFFNSYFDNTVI